MSPEGKARGALRTLGTLASLSGLGVMGAVVGAMLTTVDASDHERYGAALRQALELDARLDEEVANARLGLVTHYDGLVRLGDESTATGQVLSLAPRFLPEEQREGLAAERERYEEALAAKFALVESFKTEQAVLRNSVRALPRSAERALRLVGEGHPGLTVALNRILQQVLLLVVAPDDARQRSARCALVRLGEPAEVGGRCPSESPLLEVGDALEIPVGNVRTHARVVIERHQTLEDVVAALMAVPVSERAHSLQGAYAAMYVEAVDRSRGRWLLAFLLALVFLALGAAYIIARQVVSAAALRFIQSQLEAALGALEVERDREAELAALKSRFVSMTSHEFRTPLSVILSSAELLEAYGARWDENKRAMHLERICDATSTMSRMLDDVLLIGRAEAGMLELKPAPVDLTILAEAVVEEVRASVGLDRRLEVIDDSGDDPFVLDERLLRHVLTNLLSNAFKYSPGDSTVHFSIRRDEGAAVFEVRDEGIGIPLEDQPHLFDAFHRCSNADAIPGTGLGLAVVKKSVEVHDGTIAVDTHLGEGTVFSVRIPPISEAA